MVFHVFLENVSKVPHAGLAFLLQGKVNLAVGTYSLDIGLHAVANVQFLEDLRVEEHSAELVVDDDLYADVCLVPDEDVHLVARPVRREVLAKVALHLGAGHEAVALLVHVDVDNVALSLHHLYLLFAEGNEKVLHGSPMEEGAEVVHPGHFQESEVAHLCQRCLGGGNQAFFLIQIDKDADFVSHVHSFWNIS